MENLVELMMKLIKSEVSGTALEVASPISLSEAESKKLYSISKSHDLAHIVGSALRKSGIAVDKETEAKFQKQTFTAVYRYESINYEFNRICETLESAQIPFVPLKGSVIRNHYAEPWQRTSCDIDILVHEEDLDRAVSVLTDKLEYICDEKKNYHDISLHSKSKVHLELHFSIKETMDSIDVLLERVWEYCDTADGKLYEHRQSKEYLMFHLFAHMSYHFTHGGCGIKPFVDIYLLDLNLEYDEAKLRELCAVCGLDRFRDAVKRLIGVWFEGEPHTELTRTMELYLLKGGVYGTKEQHLALEQKKSGGKGKYILSRIFMPYDSLKLKYPSLEKRRWLTPVYQVRRWFSALFGGRTGRSVKELKTVNKIDGEKADSIAELMKEVGLG